MYQRFDLIDAMLDECVDILAQVEFGEEFLESHVEPEELEAVQRSA